MTTRMNATSGAVSSCAWGYLRDRREKVDPASLGFCSRDAGRPASGARRWQQRANVSATWYTWLEQGRGGAPSADVLDRISPRADADRGRARASVSDRARPAAGSPLPGDRRRDAATAAGAGRAAPEPRPRQDGDPVTSSPGTAPPPPCWATTTRSRPHQRNVLRMMFCEPRVRERGARLGERGALRGGDVSGGRCAQPARPKRVKALVEELTRSEPGLRAPLARQRRAGPRRRRQDVARPDRRPAFDGIFGLRGRRPPRPRHGGLQPGDARGRRAVPGR